MATAILTYLNALAVGFAAWAIISLERGGIHGVYSWLDVREPRVTVIVAYIVIGPAIFVIVNACVLFFFLLV